MQTHTQTSCRRCVSIGMARYVSRDQSWWLAAAVLLLLVITGLSVAASTPSTTPTINDAAFVGRSGADLVMRRAAGGDPVRFNGIDVIALYQSVATEVVQLTAHFNTSVATLANAECTARPDGAVRQPHFIGRRGSNAVLNAGADGRVLVDGIPVVEAVWGLRCVVDAIKIQELGSSALLPGSSGAPPLPPPHRQRVPPPPPPPPPPHS